MRCNHHWYPRKGKISEVCPRCKSRHWRTPIIKKNTMTKTTTTYSIEAGIPAIAKFGIEKKVEKVTPGQYDTKKGE